MWVGLILQSYGLKKKGPKIALVRKYEIAIEINRRIFHKKTRKSLVSKAIVS